MVAKGRTSAGRRTVVHERSAIDLMGAARTVNVTYPSMAETKHRGVSCLASQCPRPFVRKTCQQPHPRHGFSPDDDGVAGAHPNMSDQLADFVRLGSVT